MVAFNSVEQLHASSLEPKYADAIADLGPFGIEIGSNELFRERPHVQQCAFNVRPIGLARACERNRARQVHRPSRKGAKVVCRLFSIGRFTEDLAINIDHTVTSDDPVLRAVAAHTFGLGPGEIQSEFRRLPHPRLEASLINSGGLRLIFDAGGLEHLFPNGAGRREDQSQFEQPCGKAAHCRSAEMGSGSTDRFFDASPELFEESSTGMNSIPSL